MLCFCPGGRTARRDSRTHCPFTEFSVFWAEELSRCVTPAPWGWGREQSPVTAPGHSPALQRPETGPGAAWDTEMSLLHSVAQDGLGGHLSLHSVSLVLQTELWPSTKADTAHLKATA